MIGYRRRFTPEAFFAGLVIAAGFVAAASRCDAKSFDGGGRLADYLDRVLSANASGERIEISGICASACTIELGARGVCIHGDAQLWFHAARYEDGRFNALGTRLMLAEYPRRIRAWALGSGALTSIRFVTMSGAQAIALGIAGCDATNTGHDRHEGSRPGQPTKGPAQFGAREVSYAAF